MNRLAIHNSQLLATYVKFDDRVAKLGFYIKRWAKLLNLNDNYNGTFSSYAIIVMLIYCKSC